MIEAAVHLLRRTGDIIDQGKSCGGGDRRKRDANTCVVTAVAGPLTAASL
jgi:hypothetical protein